MSDCEEVSYRAERVEKRLSRCVLRSLMWAFVAMGVGCGGSSDPEEGASQHSGRSEAERPTERRGENVRALRDIPPVFSEVAEETGLKAALQLGRNEDFFFPDIMCGGAAFLDFDQDGRLDIYLIGAGTHHRPETPSPGTNPGGKNQLFRQQPDGTFADVSQAAGVDDESFGIGVAVGDFNNDSLPDIYISNFGPDRFYLNRGDGTFAECAEEAGITNQHWSASTAVGDFNRDGLLDVYVTNYVDYHQATQCYHAGDIPDFCSPQIFLGIPDTLYFNRGVEENEAGVKVPRFEDVSLSSGIQSLAFPGLGVVSCDTNQDGWPDLYVANDGTENQLWINQQDGTFVDEALLRGCAFDARGDGQAGMGLIKLDLDYDQRADFLITHLDRESNAAYVSQGTDAYTERSAPLGLGGVSLAMTGFGVQAIDLENDGDRDLIWVNGRVTAAHGRRDRPFWDRYRETNQILVHLGEGRFEERLAKEEHFSNVSEVSRALCRGDFDNDGDIDLLVTNADGPVRLYRTNGDKQNHWIGFRLRLPEHGDRDAIGAQVTIESDQMIQTDWIETSGGYCSANDPRVCFGLGKRDKIDRMTIKWPDGEVQELKDLVVDRYHTIRQGLTPDERP